MCDVTTSLYLSVKGSVITETYSTNCTIPLRASVTYLSPCQCSDGDIKPCNEDIQCYKSAMSYLREATPTRKDMIDICYFPCLKCNRFFTVKEQHLFS